MAISNSRLLQTDQAQPLLTQARKRRSKKVNFDDSFASDSDNIPEEKPTNPIARKLNRLRQRRLVSRGLSFSHCDAAPYGGKIYLARRKKSDPWYVTVLEVMALAMVIGFAIYAYCYLENVIFHVERFYAHIGHSHSQHQVGQRFLHGSGTKQNHSKAAEYFKMAADQGHPHAKYNLAVGHLKGHHEMLEPGEPRAILEDAIMGGIPEAKKVLEKFCNRGGKC